ncbi:MAG: HigA family addiction module antitoxin [Burkholderiales bacterium]
MDMRRAMEKPKHPGFILREMLLPELNMSTVELAQRLYVEVESLSEIIHERQPVSADMAMRLSRFFGNAPGAWLGMQQAYDVWELQSRNEAEYARISQYQG